MVTRREREKREKKVVSAKRKDNYSKERKRTTPGQARAV